MTRISVSLLSYHTFTSGVTSRKTHYERNTDLVLFSPTGMSSKDFFYQREIAIKNENACDYETVIE